MAEKKVENFSIPPNEPKLNFSWRLFLSNITKNITAFLDRLNYGAMVVNGMSEERAESVMNPEEDKNSKDKKISQKNPTKNPTLV